MQLLSLLQCQSSYKFSVQLATIFWRHYETWANWHWNWDLQGTTNITSGVHLIKLYFSKLFGGQGKLVGLLLAPSLISGLRCQARCFQKYKSFLFQTFCFQPTLRFHCRPKSLMHIYLDPESSQARWVVYFPIHFFFCLVFPPSSELVSATKTKSIVNNRVAQCHYALTQCLLLRGSFVRDPF